MNTLVQYSKKKLYYHGINIVALRTTEEQRGPTRDGETTPQLAEQVMNIALAESAKRADDHWPLATASEACLALHVASGDPGWCDKAELYYIGSCTTGPPTRSASRAIAVNSARSGAVTRSPMRPAPIASRGSRNGMLRAPSDAGRSILAKFKRSRTILSSSGRIFRERRRSPSRR